MELEGCEGSRVMPKYVAKVGGYGLLFTSNPESMVKTLPAVLDLKACVVV